MLDPFIRFYTLIKNLLKIIQRTKVVLDRLITMFNLAGLFGWALNRDISKGLKQFWKSHYYAAHSSATVNLNKHKTVPRVMILFHTYIIRLSHLSCYISFNRLWSMYCLEYGKNILKANLIFLRKVFFHFHDLKIILLNWYVMW